jgi:hypothetical protein
MSDERQEVKQWRRTMILLVTSNKTRRIHVRAEMGSVCKPSETIPYYPTNLSTWKKSN